MQHTFTTHNGATWLVTTINGQKVCTKFFNELDLAWLEAGNIPFADKEHKQMGLMMALPFGHPYRKQFYNYDRNGKPTIKKDRVNLIKGE